MPSTYQSSPLPHHLHVEHERISAIPLDGIAQIPCALNRFWQVYGFDVDPPADLRKATDDAIAEAMAEHQRRRIAKLRSTGNSRYTRFRHDDEDEAEELD